jgi:hypothetical protein
MFSLRLAGNKSKINFTMINSHFTEKSIKTLYNWLFPPSGNYPGKRTFVRAVRSCKGLMNNASEEKSAFAVY